MAIVACCCACSSETPEDRVRSVIEQAESAVENRELKPLMRLFSESYSDSRGNDKRAIEGLLRFSFAQYDSIHVLSRIRSLQVTGSDTAKVDLACAVADASILSLESLETMTADLLRIDVSLVEEGSDWKIVAAEWRPASLSDFLP